MGSSGLRDVTETQDGERQVTSRDDGLFERGRGGEKGSGVL